MTRLLPHIRVLNLDGSVTGQTALMARLGASLRVVDLRVLGPQVRYLCGRAAIRALEDALKPEDRHALTLIGSGDFHHVTASLLRQFVEPLSVVVFDTHSDWDRRPPLPCCGSWVAEALRIPHVSRIVSIGLSAADIGGWRVNLGRPDALRAGRIAFFPWDCDASRTLHETIRYKKVEGAEWGMLADEIIAGLPPGNVYVSVDKDCLVADEAYTNWESGGLRVAQIVDFVARLARARSLVGADIVGEWSPLTIANPFVRTIACWDHPPRPAPTPAQAERNGRTNFALVEAFLGSL